MNDSIQQHTDWCSDRDHEDGTEACTSWMSTVGGVSTWLSRNDLGTFVALDSRGGLLDPQDLRGLIVALQRYEELMIAPENAVV